jgi:NCAIR mutase (PurE)-related protein
MAQDQEGMGADLTGILEDVAAGRVPPEEAARRIRAAGSLDMGFACLDLDRERRTGVPEVVFAASKRPAEAVAIAQRLHAAHGRVLLTRVGRRTLELLRAWRGDLHHNARGRIAWLDDHPERERVGSVLVVSAGTGDLPVAEEAAETALFCGSAVRRLHDVGVAGLHRLLAHVEALRTAEVVVVVAGMEGALPGVVAGLTDRPVVAVPTSVGYGVARGGQAALRTMLATCSPGVAVVNIDNGFGAAVLAHRINRRAAGARFPDAAASLV